MKKLYILVLLHFFYTQASALNATIIESTSYNALHNMDTKWASVLLGMGHSSNIVPQTTLDNTAFFAGTDMLFVSSGVIALPANRVATIVQFLQTGKPVYLQCEYLPSYTSNQAYASIITSLGGTFNWSATFSGSLAPMNVLGSFATTNNAVSSIGYFWYSVSGVGDCNTVNFLQYGGAYHGFQYVSPNPFNGSILATTDQDWVNQSTSIPLMENIVTQMITPPPANSAYVNLGNDTTLCTGQTMTLNATTTGATYLWQNGTSNPTFNVTSAGTYWVTVTINSCSYTDTIHINYGSTLSVNIGNDTTLCNGQTMTLNATTTGATYVWQNSSTNPTFTVTSPGTYWVTVSSGAACNATDTIHVNYGSTFSLNLGNDTTLCNGQSMTLNATTAVATYSWQNNSSNPTFNITLPGTYWVNVSTAFCNATDTIHINYSPLPVVNLGNDTTVCQGQLVNLNASNLNATYVWQNSSSNPTFTVTQQGTYWVNVSNAFCSASDTIHVNYTALPVIHLGNDTTLCQGKSMLLNATTLNATYLWQDNTNSALFNVTQQGIYSVKVTVNNCSASDTIQISYSPLPVVNLGNDTTLCQGQTITLNATSFNATYLWQDNTTNPKINVTQQGIYWVKVSNAFCNASDTIQVNFNPIPIVYLGNDTTLCDGQTLLLNAGNVNASYVWQDNSTNPLFNVTQAGTYWVTVTSMNCSSTSTINITYNPLPSINLGNDTSLCPGQRFTVDATFPNATYLWNTNANNSSIQIKDAGSYWARVSTSCGTDIDTIVVKKADCDCRVFIPNAFTPNNDNKNDTFLPIVDCELTEFTFQVYNRWGQKVFETKLMNDAWDGRYKEDEAPMDVYFYLMTYVHNNEARQLKYGDVTLIR